MAVGSRKLAPDRFDLRDGTPTMKAAVTIGNGGYDQLVYRDVPVPTLSPGEVLVQVLAAGVNNTEINTRLGWYSESVSTGTAGAALAGETIPGGRPDGGWSAATPFPFIQGTDCSGRVVAAAQDVDDRMLGQRVLVRPCIRSNGFSSMDTVWMGSDFDGAFAQFVTVPASEAFPVQCDWTDVELASIPCSSGTAENMLHRVRVVHGEHVLVAGASGGVGSAVVQLAKRRGATVTAITTSAKSDQVRSIGADHIVHRDEDIVSVLGGRSVDVVVDNVAGSAFGDMLKVLRRGGRYVSSGAIGGPLVTLDMRTFYLNDLSLVGCTAWDEPVFANLISYIERGEIRPLVARTFPLEQIADAQRAFLDKQHVGNFVLIPPAVDR
jgi:2-desacetyl-2-hydroxyethyl bacteriochlorophyllide A dehydrogenase